MNDGLSLEHSRIEDKEGISKEVSKESQFLQNPFWANYQHSLKNIPNLIHNISTEGDENKGKKQVALIQICPAEQLQYNPHMHSVPTQKMGGIKGERDIKKEETETKNSSFNSGTLGFVKKPIPNVGGRIGGPGIGIVPAPRGYSPLQHHVSSTLAFNHRGTPTDKDKDKEKPGSSIQNTPNPNPNQNQNQNQKEKESDEDDQSQDPPSPGLQRDPSLLSSILAIQRPDKRNLSSFSKKNTSN